MHASASAQWIFCKKPYFNCISLYFHSISDAPLILKTKTTWTNECSPFRFQIVIFKYDYANETANTHPLRLSLFLCLSVFVFYCISQYFKVIPWNTAFCQKFTVHACGTTTSRTMYFFIKIWRDNLSSNCAWRKENSIRAVSGLVIA